MAFIAGNNIIQSTSAFSNYAFGSPPKQRRNLFAASQSDDDHFSCDGMIKKTPALDWNLQSLLSSDPAMDARFVPLMQIYEAAAVAAEEKATMDGEKALVKST